MQQNNVNPNDNLTVKRYTVGPLPLLDAVVLKLKLREILLRYISRHGSERVHPVDSLLLIIYNLAIGKDPLYEMEHWCSSLDLHRIGIPDSSIFFNDDRFGKALDKLYQADLSCLMTDLAIAAIHGFNIQTPELHNDATSIKAYGRISGKTRRGLELKHGNSKDHRPDLKQLILSLTISADGGIPLHHRCYSGNRTDDTTHIETWNTLRRIVENPGFLYVGDSKLCTHKQLSHIATNGGRAITIIPETWGEVMRFKNELHNCAKKKNVIWRRFKPNSSVEKEYFSAFKGDYLTDGDEYRIHWVYSSEKRQRDHHAREAALRKAEAGLNDLNTCINTRRLKTIDQINLAVDKILTSTGVKAWLRTTISTHRYKTHRQVGKGRPSAMTHYTVETQISYGLAWSRDRQALAKEARTDGIFPLLCTDKTLKTKKVLQAYKYQPHLEKRFQQFKTVHNAAPLLFKKIERIEANMFAFFIALMIQALLEREIRNNMKSEDLEKLYIYPEDRECMKPTTSIVFDRFTNLSRYELYDNGKKAAVKHMRDDFSRAQLAILSIMKISDQQYWNRK